MQTSSPLIDRAALLNIVVIGRGSPYRPLPTRDVEPEIAARIVAPYRDLVRAGYATEAPLGDGRHEFRITQSGRDYLAATRKT